VTKRAAPKADGPLLLLDGMSLAFRAFFALPPEMKTKDGVVTNAAFGFMSMLSLLVRDHYPSGVAVAFDLPGTTFRDEIVTEYKGGRDATPPELEPQFGIIIDLLGALAIPVVTKPSYEADDVLATLATRARDEGRDVIVVTGDRDCFQLVEDPHVRVLYNRRGVSDYSLYDEAGIIERTGVEPRRYPLLAALRGDPSDNLPGVPGIGEKTAAKLLAQFAGFEELFSGLGQLTPKLRASLAANEELARRNAAVMVLVRDLDLDVDPAQRSTPSRCATSGRASRCSWTTGSSGQARTPTTSRSSTSLGWSGSSPPATRPSSSPPRSRARRRSSSRPPLTASGSTSWWWPIPRTRRRRRSAARRPRGSPCCARWPVRASPATT
jgi:5'-3' exonuclease